MNASVAHWLPHLSKVSACLTGQKPEGSAKDHGSVLWCAPKHTKWLPKSPLHSFLAIKNTAKLRCYHVQLGWMLISEIAKSP